MNRNEIEIGSMVQLKTGGPALAVSEVRDKEGGTWVTCIWFEAGKEKIGSFDLRILELYDPYRGLNKPQRFWRKLWRKDEVH